MRRNALMMPIWRQVVGVAVAAIVASFASDGFAGGPIVNTAGFEAFNAGPLAGQQGWASVGSGAATIQSTVVKSGTKAVKVDKSAGSDSRWGDVVTGYPTERFIMVNWDMRVTGTGAGAGNFGPVLGVEAYDASSPSAIKLLGSLFVDATTGDVLYQDSEGILTETGTLVTFDAWHNYGLVADFTLDKYSYFVDGTKIGSAEFVDGGSTFTDADISALAAFSDTASQNRLGTAYFDNFIVRDGIPGDFDADGDIDAGDFTKWKTGFGTTTGDVADSDGDHDSDGADFLTWQRERGGNLIAATPVAASVPEPAAAALAVLAAVAGSAISREKSRRHQLA